VLGTLLITFGVMNAIFGAASTAAAIKLASISTQVKGSEEAIRIGQTVRSISGGVLSIGDNGTGAAVQSAIKALPSPWVAGVLGVARVALAAWAIVLGSMLVRRRQREMVLGHLVLWSVASIALGAAGIWFVGLPTARLIGGVGGYCIAIIDIATHIVWPAVVFARIRRALETNEPLEC
jgi:hypothetical protein